MVTRIFLGGYAPTVLNFFTFAEKWSCAIFDVYIFSSYFYYEDSFLEKCPQQKYRHVLFFLRTYQYQKSCCSVFKVKSCKLYNNKYMIASTQITSTEIFAFAAALVSMLLSRKVLLINRRQQKLLKSRLLFKKIASFTGKLLQDYK